MWEDIKKIIPEAKLDIYVDLENVWLNQYHGQQIIEIKNLLEKYKNWDIINHGWVDKKTLCDSWSTAGIWLYPCIFQETFCHTALEAAASKTLVITTDLAALNETVSDRGVIIKGDPFSQEWKDTVIEILKVYKQDPEFSFQDKINKNYNWSLNLSWEERAKEFQSKYLI